MRLKDDVETEMELHGRICLKPVRWQKLWKMLPDRESSEGTLRPPAPLILAAWWDTPDILKMTRFKEHLTWAEENGTIDEIYTFLMSLDDDDWHYG